MPKTNHDINIGAPANKVPRDWYGGGPLSRRPEPWERAVVLAYSDTKYPARRLLAAVLMDGIAGVRKGRVADRHWLMATDDDLMGFEGLCSWIDVQPSDVRNSLKEFLCP